MSIIGTGIAAGVANTGNTARTQTTTSSGKDAQRASAADQTDKLTLSQLHGAGATRDTDQDLPDGQAPGYEELYEGDTEAQADAEDEQDNPNDQIHRSDAPASSPTHLPLQPTYAPDAQDLPLFHAIDVKA